MFGVNSGALLGVGFRFRIFSVGASVALLLITVSKRFFFSVLECFMNLQGQCGEGIHDKVDPEKLYRVQNTVARPIGDRGHESQ